MLDKKYGVPRKMTENVRSKTPKRKAVDEQGYVPIPAAHDTEPILLDGRTLEPGDEILLLQQGRPPAPARVVYVGPRRAWVRVALDFVGGRSPLAEFLIGSGTLVKRRD
jgi:hypothetical protein